MTIALAFGLLMVPMVLKHNGDLSVVTAIFIDSGSLLGDYIKMAGSPVDFNQNIRYHAGIYGWVYNSLIASGIFTINFVYSLAGCPPSFSTISAFARSISLLLTCLGLSALYLMVREQRGARVWAVLIVLAVMLFPPVVKFSYEIHPEPSGFLFSVLALLFASRFINSSCEKELYLNLSWVAAILATLSKQSFMMYALVPIGAALIFYAQESNKGSARRMLFRTSTSFLVIAVAAVAIFHTHALLNPIQFLEKQASIRSFHSTMYKPLGESMWSWTLLIIQNEYWMLFGLLAAIVRLAMNRFRGAPGEKMLDVACVALIATFIVFVLELRFYFLRGYLYPLIALVIFVLISLAQRANKFGRLSIYLMLISVMPFYAVNTAGVVSRDFLLDGAVNMRLVQKLREIGPRDWNVVYSASLPVSNLLYKKTLNSFQFTPSDVWFDKSIANAAPDVVMIDSSFVHSDPDKFAKAAAISGLVEAGELFGESPVQWTCDMHKKLSFRECSNQFFYLIGRDAAGPPAMSKVIYYSKPELIKFFN